MDGWRKNRDIKEGNEGREKRKGGCSHLAPRSSQHPRSTTPAYPEMLDDAYNDYSEAAHLSFTALPYRTSRACPIVQVR